MPKNKQKHEKQKKKAKTQKQQFQTKTKTKQSTTKTVMVKPILGHPLASSTFSPDKIIFPFLTVYFLLSRQYNYCFLLFPPTPKIQTSKPCARRIHCFEKYRRKLKISVLCAKKCVVVVVVRLLLNVPQHARVSQGSFCIDICCNTEIEVADQTFYLTQSQYTDTGPTSLSADPVSPCA